MLPSQANVAFVLSSLLRLASHSKIIYFDISLLFYWVNKGFSFSVKLQNAFFYFDLHGKKTKTNALGCVAVVFLGGQYSTVDTVRLNRNNTVKNMKCAVKYWLIWLWFPRRLQESFGSDSKRRGFHNAWHKMFKVTGWLCFPVLIITANPEMAVH